MRTERKAVPGATETDGYVGAASGDSGVGKQRADSAQSTALGVVAAVEEASDVSQSRLAQVEEDELSARRTGAEREASEER